MTPTILRMTLAVAVMLGVGVVMNIFSSQQRYAEMRGAIHRPSTPAPVLATNKVGREAEVRRVADAVRRQLENRGYLESTADTPAPVALPAAILAFEFDHNLGLTAEPTDRLLKVMIFAQMPVERQRPVRPGTDVARELIGEVQRALAHLGYGEPDITMELDAKTRTAIRKFERARGLQVSGRVSAPLIKRLGPAFDATKVQTATMTSDGNAATLTASNESGRD
jgi:peptidoglycan hydrolase-like protein with peptidoglycan-binding domain